MKHPEEKKEQWVPSPFGQESRPLHLAVLGGGEAACSLLRILNRNELASLGVKVIGVWDPNPDAPGHRLAEECHLFHTVDLQEIWGLPDLHLVVELTGLPERRKEIDRQRPPGVSYLDQRAAKLLFGLTHLGSEKGKIEKDRKPVEVQARKETQVILDSLPYRIMVMNTDMTVETVNRTFLKEFRTTFEEVKGRPCYEVRYQLDRPCQETRGTCLIADRLEEIITKGAFSTIREYKDEQGRARFDVITIAPIYNETGEIVQILEASRDVTERIRLEREVQKSNTFFQNVIESTVDGIVVVDTKGKVLIFNEGMEKLTGYPAREIIEHGHLSSFYDIDTAKENMRKMRSGQYGSLGKLNPTSMTIKTKQGQEIPVTLSASIITIDGKEVGSVGVFRDMREILKMRKDLEEAHLQLVQSDKIASIGRMAAGVAHEINNPLSGILLYAELLKEGAIGGDQALQDTQEIIHQTLRCKKIVSQLLEFSRESIGKASAFSLETMLRNCLNLLIYQASFQNIRLTVDIEPNIPEMVGDMGQLQQVFTNLFINAADAMEGKGSLQVGAHFDRAQSRFVITVSDTGPGIPSQLRDKVFDIFFTTKPVGKGTGLGLSISQKIIALHGGSITFHCPPEGGTTFRVELPLEFTESMQEQPVFIGLDEP